MFWNLVILRLLLKQGYFYSCLLTLFQILTYIMCTPNDISSTGLKSLYFVSFEFEYNVTFAKEISYGQYVLRPFLYNHGRSCIGIQTNSQIRKKTRYSCHLKRLLRG